MPMIDEKFAKICSCIVAWDGITNPENAEGGGHKYSLKVILPPGNPDAPLLEPLAQKALADSKWRGTLPANARWPLSVATANEFNGLYPGATFFNVSTYSFPDVYDESGRLMDSMEVNDRNLFQGQLVDILIDAKDYDNVQKGIKFRLYGFCIRASAGATRQQLSAGGINTANVFGGGSAPAQQPAAPQATMQAPQQYAQPQYAGQPAPGQGSPMQPAAPQQYAQQPAAPQQPGMQPAAQQATIQPMQAHNMLPNQ